MAITLYRQSDGAVLTGDSVLRIGHMVDVQVPEQPIEDGSSISDHAVVRPRVYVVPIVVTETPFVPSEDNTEIVGPARLQAAKAWLDSSIGELLTLSGGRYGDIPDLVINGYAHEEGLAGDETFVIRLKQVQTATVESVQIPLGQPTEPTASSRVDSGQQATEVLCCEDPRVVKDQSIAYRAAYGQSIPDADLIAKIQKLKAAGGCPC